MWTAQFEVETGSRPAVYDITGRVNDALRGTGDGLLLVFLPHATAGLALLETGSGSDADLLDRLADWLLAGAAYRHRHGAPGHGRDHVLPAVIPPGLTLPVRNSRLDLGVWQSLVVVDTNVDNQVRTVRLYLIRESAGP